jgi:pyruvate/2-oxoglutarate dehydrogenase complex dihydrolipoamide dehydrogenase (E3) component
MQEKGKDMSERFDVIVIGAGPGGEVAADRLHRGGMRVAMVERELIGGECAYWACIPSKTLIRPTAVVAEASHVAGVARPAINWKQVAAYRDDMIRHLDDSKQVKAYADQGITIIRGEAHLAGPGRVDVAGRTLEAPHVVVATGSDPRIPPIEGLREAGYWTNREATTFSRVPESIVILGGSAQGIELGQMLHRYGAEVTIVQDAAHLLDREEPEVGDLLADLLRAEGVNLRLGREAIRVARDPDGMRVVHLDDGTEVRGQELLVATGRTPRTDSLHLEAGDATVTRRGIQVDDFCRAAPGLWAVGDVTGMALFTHVAKYQARIAADDILGRRHPAAYMAVPRVVFSDPEVGSTGLTTAQAHERGLDVVRAVVDLYEAIARPVTYGKDIGGRLGLVADRKRGVLVGAWAVGPEAGEWIHLAVLAIRAATPIPVLRDVIEQFPTFSEAYLSGLEMLAV